MFQFWHNLTRRTSTFERIPIGIVNAACSSSHLFDLPRDFLLNLLETIGNLKEIAVLDTSVTNKKEREILLSLLRSKEISFESYPHLEDYFDKGSYEEKECSLEQLSYCKLRKIKLRCLRAPESTPFHTLLELAAISGNSLRSLHLHRTPELSVYSIEKLARLCPQIQEIKLWDEMNTKSEVIDDIVIAIAREWRDKLKVADFSHGATLGDDSVMALAEFCPQLERFDSCWWNKVTGQSIERLCQKCPSILHLNLNGCKLDANAIKAIADALCSKHHGVPPPLRSLSLAWCNGVSIHSITHLVKKIPHLLSLCLSASHEVSDDILAEIANYCCLLRELYINGCRRVTDVGVLYICMHRGKYLHNFEIASCARLTSSSFLTMGQLCPNITKLNIGQNDNIPHDFHVFNAWNGRLQAVHLSTTTATIDRFVSDLSQYCNNLQIVELEHCRLLSDISLIYLAKNCKFIRHLVLNRNCSITDHGITVVCKACRGHLEKISLSACESITSTSVYAVAKYVPNLTYLDVSYNDNINDSSIVEIAKGCKRLRSLGLSSCEQITDLCMTKLITQCSRLIELDIDDCALVSDHMKQRLEQRKIRFYLSFPTSVLRHL